MAKKTLVGILAAIGLGSFFLKQETKASEEYRADMDLSFVSKNSVDMLAQKYTRQQLEAALVHSVSLNNKSAQEKLDKAIRRQAFVQKYQSEEE
jgi:hypothetical protein